MKSELLAPAGSYQGLQAVIRAGADAVYIGYEKYGARIQAGNSMQDLIELIEFAHIYRVKVYITINTILKKKFSILFFLALCSVLEYASLYFF